MVHSESVLYNLCNCLPWNGRSHKLLKVMFLEQRTDLHTLIIQKEMWRFVFFSVAFRFLFRYFDTRASNSNNQHGGDVKGKKTKDTRRRPPYRISHYMCCTHSGLKSTVTRVATAAPELLYTSAQRHISVENMAHAFQESHRKTAFGERITDVYAWLCLYVGREERWFLCQIFFLHEKKITLLFARSYLRFERSAPEQITNMKMCISLCSLCN